MITLNVWFSIRNYRTCKEISLTNTQVNRNCHWEGPDIRLTRQILSTSYFKYIQSTKRNHVWTTKGKYENDFSSNGGYKEVEFKLNNLKSKREPSRKGGVEKYNNENAKFTGGGWSKQIWADQCTVKIGQLSLKNRKEKRKINRSSGTYGSRVQTYAYCEPQKSNG